MGYQEGSSGLGDRVYQSVRNAQGIVDWFRSMCRGSYEFEDAANSNVYVSRKGFFSGKRMPLEEQDLNGFLGRGNSRLDRAMLRHLEETDTMPRAVNVLSDDAVLRDSVAMAKFRKKHDSDGPDAGKVSAGELNRRMRAYENIGVAATVMGGPSLFFYLETAARKGGEIANNPQTHNYVQDAVNDFSGVGLEAAALLGIASAIGLSANANKKTREELRDRMGRGRVAFHGMNEYKFTDI